MDLPVRNCRMLDRQRRVAALHLRGMTPEEIAERVGADKARVSRDLQTLREQVQSESELNIQELRVLELMRIKLLEEPAWGEIESGQWIMDDDEGGADEQAGAEE